MSFDFSPTTRVSDADRELRLALMQSQAEIDELREQVRQITQHLHGISSVPRPKTVHILRQ